MLVPVGAGEPGQVLDDQGRTGLLQLGPAEPAAEHAETGEPDPGRGLDVVRETDVPMFGGGQIILVDEEALVAGSDPRKDGYAGGF